MTPRSEEIAVANVAPGRSSSHDMNKPVCEDTGPRCPSTSPATTCHTHDALGPETCNSSSLSNPRYHGSQRFSAAGKFIHTWMISSGPPDSRKLSGETSACSMPRPAVIHWTPPAPVTKVWPVESLCATCALKHKRQRLKPFVRMGPKRQPSILGRVHLWSVMIQKQKRIQRRQTSSWQRPERHQIRHRRLQVACSCLTFELLPPWRETNTPIPNVHRAPIRKTPRPRCSQQI